MTRAMRCAPGGATLLLACVTATAGPAVAVDLAPAQAIAEPGMLDVAFGVAGMTDYRFRGVTQSAGKPAVQGYVELQAFDWIYAGLWSTSVSFPSRFGLTDPAAEIDFYAGLRHAWGAFSLDAGYLYYWYPGETKTFPGQKQTEYWELKATPTVAFGDAGSVTANIWWSPDYANTGSNELYLSLTPKIDIPLSSFPDLGLYVSGEFGKQWINKADNGFDPKDYLTWNVGAGVTYKAMTLDLRYSDTTLSKSDCFASTGARTWCGGAVVGKISFDASLGNLR